MPLPPVLPSVYVINGDSSGGSILSMNIDEEERPTRIDLTLPRDSQSPPPIPEPDSYVQGSKAKTRKSNLATSKKRKASTPEKDATNKLKKPRVVASPAREEVDPRTGLKDLYLPKAVEAGISVVDKTVDVQNGSPGKSFKKVFKLELDSFVIVATRNDRSGRLAIVKCFEGPAASEAVRMLQTIRHENFVTFLEYFNFEGCHHVILDYIDVTAAHIIRSDVYPDELQLAALVGQIVHGVAYLHSHELEHGALSPLTVLVDDNGDVKITGQEFCRKKVKSVNSSNLDIRALARITMKLMDKTAKDEGPIGVTDLIRWPGDSDAASFLALTTSATSVTELLKHPLQTRNWRKEDLPWLVKYARIDAFIGHKDAIQV